MKSLGFIATYNCNMNCTFCIFYKRRMKQQSIPITLARKILNNAKLNGYSLIGLTGGEMCLHPQFEELIDLIVKNGFYFGITSNGYGYKKYIPLLKYKEKFNYITFSMDGPTEKLHDKLRKKGSFRKVKEAIKFFSKNGVDTRVQMCLNKYNSNEMEKTAILAEKLGANRLRYLSTIPTGYNKKFVLSDKEREECYRKIEQIKRKVSIEILSSSSLHTPRAVNFCVALDLSYVGVHPNGDLVFCCDISEGGVLGNLKKNSLSELIKKGYELTNYLKEKKKECIYLNVFFEGFDTCAFCNEYIKQKIY